MHERQEELYAELDNLECEIKKIEKEKEKLSKALKEKFEELDEANGLIENQSFELDGIRKDCNNEVKNLLLKRDNQIEQLEEDLLRNAKEGYSLEMLESVVDKAEKLVNDNRAIGDYSRKIILQETQKIKCILKQIIQFSPGEDLGYESLPNSCLSTPIKLPNSLLTESYERNQSEGICKT